MVALSLVKMRHPVYTSITNHNYPLSVPHHIFQKSYIFIDQTLISYSESNKLFVSLFLWNHIYLSKITSLFFWNIENNLLELGSDPWKFDPKKIYKIWLLYPKCITTPKNQKDISQVDFHYQKCIRPLESIMFNISL